MIKEGDWIRWRDVEDGADHTGRVSNTWRELQVVEDGTRKTFTIYEAQAQTLEVCDATLTIDKAKFKCENLNTRFHMHESHVPGTTARVSWK